MARFTRVRVEGLKHIEEALAELPKSLGKAALVRVAKRRLQPMADAARARAPEDSGKLRQSIIVGTKQGAKRKPRSVQDEKAAVEVYMGPSRDGYPQALPQEFGSPNNPPRGYMRGAWDQEHDDLLTGIAKDLGTEVDKTAKRYAKRQARRGG